MKVKTRGKIYLMLGIVILIFSIWFEIPLLAFASGILFAWGYWYWVRLPIMRFLYSKKENWLQMLENSLKEYFDDLNIENITPLNLKEKGG